MSNAISLNLQMSVRDGQLNDARDLMNDMVAATREEPGTQNYEWFLSEDGKTCHINERYTDSGAEIGTIGSTAINLQSGHSSSRARHRDASRPAPKSTIVSPVRRRSLAAETSALLRDVRLGLL